MTTLKLKRKINRKRRIIVKKKTETAIPETNTPPKSKLTLKLKPSPPTKKEKSALDIEHLRAEKKKRAVINLEKEKKQKEARHLAIRALSKKLNIYPVWHDCLPMQIGVKQLILEKFKGNECSNKAIRELIGKHCKRRKYLENIITHGKRHDLFTGKIVADVTQVQKDKAQKLLDIFNQFLVKST